MLVALTGKVPGGRHKPGVPVSPAVAGTILASSVALGLSLAGLAARRVGRIQSLCLHGREVEARVREVRRFRGGQMLELELGRAGATHRARYSLQRGSGTPAFEEGTQIRVLVDPEHPKLVVPLALYTRAADVPGGTERSLPTGRSGAAQRAPRS